VDNDGTASRPQGPLPVPAETKTGSRRGRCPDEPDKDGDGVPDSKDKCPNDQRTGTTSRTGDGCPDPVHRQRRSARQVRRLRERAGGHGRFKDDDGCPDADNDGDGICDPWVRRAAGARTYAKGLPRLGQVPKEPETYNGIKDDDGLPDRGAAT